MKISSVKEFRDNATKLLRSNDPILVMRRGQLAGIFFPCPEKSIPLELKRELFPLLASEVARQMRRSGVGEKELVEGFKEWRKRPHQKNQTQSRKAALARSCGLASLRWTGKGLANIRFKERRMLHSTEAVRRRMNW